MRGIPSIEKTGLADLEAATDAARTEIAEFRADVRDELGLLREQVSTANRTLGKIADTLAEMNARESYFRGDPKE